MSFKYWEYKSELENKQSEEIVSEVCTEVETAVSEVVVPPCEINEALDSEEQQIETYASSTEIPEVKNQGKKSTARKIFVDGLLGIPFITVVLILISTLVAALTIITIGLGAGTIAGFGATLLSIAYSFISFSSTVSTALIILSAGLVLGAVSFLLMILTALLGGKAIPAVAGLYVSIVKKLHLFR